MGDKRKQSLSDKQKKLLLRNMLRSKEIKNKPQIKSVREKNILSFAQQRMWLLHQLDPSGSQYNMYDAFVIQGLLDYKTLQKSINAIVKKHKILRTVYKLTKEEEPVQPIILPFKEQDIRVVEKKGDHDIESFISSEVAQPFDLERGPLFEVTLIRKHESYHALLFRMHHILADGWSFAILRKELKSMYETFINLEEVQEESLSILQEPKIQYSDFACWQKERFENGEYENQIQYWKNQLQGIQTLNVPTDFQRPKVQSNKGARYQSLLNKDLTERIEQFCHNHNCTLYMFMLAAYSTLLYRYTDQKDFCIGSPIANRNSKELENIIGFFVNTLVIRSQLSENESFSELLERITNTTLEAFRNQDVPFEKIVEIVNPERSMSHNPLVQVAYVHHNTPSEKLFFSDLAVEEYYVNQTTSKFDLLMITWKKDDVLNIAFDYSTDLFSENTVQRIVNHLFHLIDQVLEDRHRPISELELLTSDEWNMLKQWNQTDDNTQHYLSVPLLFKEQVKKSPDDIALEFESTTCTYTQLDIRSNQIASMLIKKGVKKGDTVGLYLDRSLHTIEAILGILKAGAAYVPLDPNYPVARLQLIVDNGNLNVIITDSSLDQYWDLDTVKILYLDKEWELVNQDSTEHPPIHLSESDLAYVFYTSGSTGVPKGVTMSHGALSNMLYWQINSHYRSKEFRTLQFTSLNFDVSFQEIFSTLCAGGTLVLVDESTRKDTNTLFNYIIQKKVNKLFIPYVLLKELAKVAMNKSSFPVSLKEIFTAGEQLHVTQEISMFLKKASYISLYNQYGPTETHVATSHKVTDFNEALPPIGKPIANIQVYILDKHHKPVPIGVAGEIYLAGKGLSLGYLNQEQLTEEVFIPNPFGKKGSRLYKTGDLAKYLADGTIHYLGRLDNQVKVNGMRVEIGEVEKALNANDYIINCAVVPYKNNGGDIQQLIAYVVVEGKRSITNLRAYLSQKLPEYMIPHRFIFLDQLPINPNGKVDRKALPAPSMERPELSNYAAPSTDLEVRMAEIWSDVLGVERVGIHDNFFELGGHSLLATRVVLKIHDQFHMDLPLRDMFEHQTIHELVGRIQSMKQQKAKKTSLIPVEEQDTDLPLSFAQQRMWLLHCLDPDSVAYHVCGAIQINGTLNQEALKRGLETIVERHKILRTRFVYSREKGVPVQIIDSSKASTVQLMVMEEEQVQAFISREMNRPFDLEKGPLFEPTLIKLSDTKHLLFLRMHHIVSDGWSTGVFSREIKALYEGYANGVPLALPPLPIQYSDFAYWQRKRYEEGELESQINYWKEKLQDVSPLELPTDYPRPSRPMFSGKIDHLQLTEEETKQIKEWCQQHNGTLYMFMLGILKILLYRYTQQEDLCIGTPIANRNQTETENLIGFFVNTLVLRTNVSGEYTYPELFEDIRESSLEAYANQDLPFEKIVELVSPERDVTNTNPLFQVVYAHQNATSEALEFEGLKVEEYPLEHTISKFDLTFLTSEKDGYLHVKVEYNTDLFKESTIQQLLGHLQKILKEVLSNPQVKVKNIDLLTEKERQLQVEEWNNTQTAYPRQKSVDQLFEEQTAKTPDSIALEEKGMTLTYQEVNEHSNQLARYLLRQGIEPGDYVGIWMNSSISMVISMLGILKVGGVYVPLDRSLPEERVKDMVEGINSVVTTREMAKDASTALSNLIYLDQAQEEMSKLGSRNLLTRETGRKNERAEEPAYVMFTSGSTGKPKGVVIPHRGIVRLVKDVEYVQLDSEEIILQIAPVSFDASTFEIWGALLNGGKLVLMPKEKPSLSELGQWIREYKATTIWLTAGLFHQLVDRHLEDLQGLNQLLAGGDVLSVHHCNIVRRTFPHCRLINGYGPTENTTFTCTYTLEENEYKNAIPIGKPINNTQVYLLDQALQPVPIGVAGELFIGGDGLAKGYLNQEEQTRNQFIQHPWKKGERLYRTGDLARYRRDGTIEFLGRKDFQVKIRGYRIELEEIERVIQQLSGVEDAVVYCWGEREEKTLVAYIVGVLEEGWIQKIRTSLEEKLPAYMIPNRFLQMEKLPLTLNGKVDRKALPAPSMERPELSNYVAPSTDLEVRMAEIWSDVLGVEQVGIHDNFFELGGHSLLATQIVALIFNQFHIELPLRKIFEKPTIHELVNLLEKEKSLQHGKNQATNLESIFNEIKDLSVEEVKNRLMEQK